MPADAEVGVGARAGGGAGDSGARARRRRRLRLAGRYLVLTGLALVVLFPVYVAVVGSLLRPEQIVQRPPALFPSDPQWGSYGEAWTDGHFSRYLVNSAVVTGIITVAQVLTSILAGYAFALLDFPGKRAIFVVFLATMMVPFEVTIVTNLTTVSEGLGPIGLDWRDSYAGLTVPFLATGFGAFLLRQAFLQIPAELQDAAALDGCGHLRFLRLVAVPLARPTIAALGLFSFLAAWNQYLWPLLVTDDERLRTVQVGLKHLRTSQVDGINVTLAGTVLAALPLVVLLVVFQRQLVRGLAAGAVKG
jgi:sn-glycerol 3-phosphate transport system permease protein